MRLKAKFWERVNELSADRQQQVTFYIAKALIVATDGWKIHRLLARECTFCYYLGRKDSGQMLTEWACLGCSTPSTHGSVAVPKLCNNCSDTYDLCVTCGGDLNMQNRPKLSRRAKKKRKKSNAKSKQD